MSPAFILISLGENLKFEIVTEFSAEGKFGWFVFCCSGCIVSFSGAA